MALVAFVVSVRLLIFTRRSRAAKGRLAMMLGGAGTLLGIGMAGLFDAADNLLWHPEMPIIPSAWLSGIAGLVTAVWFELFGRYSVERAAFVRQLETLATTDPLTGILNRRACLERGQELAGEAQRFLHPLTVMMIDIDHFKEVNDRHGHETGDEILRLFATVVKGCLRQVDVFGRMGGEEFAVLMPETAGPGALIATERIREAVEGAVLKHGETPIRITVSIGAVAGSESVKEALRQADKALYRAKTEGRNRVVMMELPSD